MFGQYTIESRIKKDRKKHGTYVEIPRRKMDPLEINELARKNVRDLVLLGGAVYTLKKLADAGATVTVILADSKLH